MSALPKAVRAQVERANKIAEEYYKTGQPPADPNAPPADPNAAPTAAAPAEPAAPAADPAAPTAAAPAAAPPASVTPLPDPDWKQKYNVLQGKYNAEVPRLQRQVSELSTQLRDVNDTLISTQRLLASLAEQQKGSAPSAQPSQGTPPSTTKLIKDEEVREFGADLIDVMRRVVREENASILPEIDRRVAPVRERVDQVAHATQQVGARVAQSDQQTVLSMLASAVPNWQELNEDPAFLEWLDQVDPYAGAPRGQLLKQAYKAHDGSRVVAFFTGYLKEHAAVSPTPAPAPAAAAPPAAPQRKLEQFVAPGAPKTGAASAQDGSGKRVWTRAEISQFYAGKMHGTPEQKKAWEADIFAAQREGRIR